MVLIKVNTTAGVAIINLDDVSSIIPIPEGSQINFKSPSQPPLLNTSTPEEIWDKTPISDKESTA